MYLSVAFSAFAVICAYLLPSEVLRFLPGFVVQFRRYLLIYVWVACVLAALAAARKSSGEMPVIVKMCFWVLAAAPCGQMSFRS